MYFSAGTGRTGIFIVLDIIMHQLRELGECYASCLTFSLPYMTEISVVIRQWT